MCDCPDKEADGDPQPRRALALTQMTASPDAAETSYERHGGRATVGDNGVSGEKEKRYGMQSDDPEQDPVEAGAVARWPSRAY